MSRQDLGNLANDADAVVTEPGMALTLNGVAQGYIADRVAGLLRAEGLDNLLVRARLPWVEIKAAQGLALNLDGEPLTGDSLRFSAHKGALRVHLPQNSPLLSP